MKDLPANTGQKFRLVPMPVWTVETRKNFLPPLAIELPIPWSSSNFNDPQNNPTENLISHQKIFKI